MLDVQFNYTDPHFFDAVGVKAPNTPTWLIRVEQSTPILDARGVDAIAFVQYPDRDMHVRVPIQLKSHKSRLPRYYLHHSWAWSEEIIVLVFHLYDGPQYIRVRLYRELERVREQRRTFDSILNKLQFSPQSFAEEKMVEHIENQRRLSGQRVPGAEVHAMKQWKRLEQTTAWTRGETPLPLSQKRG